jgi:hypothetical protein
MKKPKDLRFAGGGERYQLQLRQVTAESRQQTLWDRSGAGRKFAVRAVLLDSTLGHDRRRDSTRH